MHKRTSDEIFTAARASYPGAIDEYVQMYPITDKGIVRWLGAFAVDNDIALASKGTEILKWLQDLGILTFDYDTWWIDRQQNNAPLSTEIADWMQSIINASDIGVGEDLIDIIDI